MALIRALNTSVSGVQAMSNAVDQIGDNLANSNTPGFKSKQVRFQNILSQTLRFGTEPAGNLGGTDPKQIGIGVEVSETNTNFSQGALKTTGQNTDMAIEGDGFFPLMNAQGGQVFTRDGTFGLNQNKQLINPSNGFKVMGLNADLNTFEVPEGGTLEPINIPLGDLKIAQASEKIKFNGNLNFDGELAGSGAELHSAETFLNSSGGDVELDDELKDLQKDTPTGAVDAGIEDGDVIKINAEKGPRELPEKTFKVSSTPDPDTDGFGTTVDDLVDFMEGALGIADSGDNTDLNTDAYSSNALEDVVESADSFNTSGSNDEFVADSTNWVNEGVEEGDYFRILSGEAAGQNIQIKDITTTNTTNDTLVFEDPGLDETLPEPSTDDKFAINEHSRVALGTDGGTNNSNALEDRNVDQGKLSVFSNAGKDNAISNLGLSIKDDGLLTTFNEVEEASGESAIANTTIFDSRGKPHRTEVTYTKVAESNSGTKWRWIAESEDQVGQIEDANSNISTDSKTFVDDRVVGSGFIEFNEKGEFDTENPKPNISMDLSNTGAETPLTVTLNHENLTALSNFSSEVEVKEQDGFEQGVLNDFSVGGDGTITGQFDNGMTRTIAKMQLARFSNNDGLVKNGANMFKVGANSGDPVIGNPGEFGRGTIRGGAIEESNVDVAQQFTELITNQRAFQANARTISTADQMLQEIVNIR